MKYFITLFLTFSALIYANNLTAETEPACVDCYWENDFNHLSLNINPVKGLKFPDSYSIMRVLGENDEEGIMFYVELTPNKQASISSSKGYKLKKTELTVVVIETDQPGLFMQFVHVEDIYSKGAGKGNWKVSNTKIDNIFAYVDLTQDPELEVSRNNNAGTLYFEKMWP